jgi:hypothetical protein
MPQAAVGIRSPQFSLRNLQRAALLITIIDLNSKSQAPNNKQIPIFNIQ